MPGPPPPAPPGGFVFRSLKKPEEFRTAEELQRGAFGEDAALALPAPLLRAVQDNGGLVLGAFVDIHLAGCVAASIGWDGTTLYHQGLALAVRPEYQNHHVGFRLQAFLRDEVRRLGLAEVRWAIDPLHPPSAALSIRHLGARPDAYLPNYFGHLGRTEARGHETDRLHLCWPLASPEVGRRLAGGVPSAEDDRARHAASSTLIETEVGEHGLRQPTAVAEPSGASAHLEVPFDLGSIRTHEAAAERRWRHAVRDAFRTAFDLGYVVDDFASVRLEHERRDFYFLRAPAEGAVQAGAPSTPS